jgi:hypothetical protein
MSLNVSRGWERTSTAALHAAGAMRLVTDSQWITNQDDELYVWPPEAPTTCALMSCPFFLLVFGMNETYAAALALFLLLLKEGMVRKQDGNAHI